MTFTNEASTFTMQDSTYARLIHVDEKRWEEALAFIQAGGRTVGYIGDAVPVELITAAGFRAVEITPHPQTQAGLSADYMEPEAHWAARALFDEITSGKWAFLEFVVLDRSNTTLALYLREVKRLGLAPETPAIWTFDFIPGPTQRHEGYNSRELARLKTRLESSGRSITPARLNDAIAGQDQVRWCLHDLQSLRSNRKITGADASRFYRAATAMEALDFSGTVGPLLERLDRSEATAGLPSVLVSAEKLYTPSLHRTLEAEGFLLTGEDAGCGLGRETTGIGISASPMTAISSWYQANSGQRLTHPFAWRNRWLLGVQPSDVQAVLFYVPQTDQRLGWDVPRIRARLDGQGIASAVIHHDLLSPGARLTDDAMDSVRMLTRAGAAPELR